MAGCQTVKMAKPFSAAHVLPDNESMYVKIPVKENKDLCHTIINTYISGLTEENSSELLDRSDFFYASVNFETKAVNAAIVGDFPFFIDMVFTESNGWKTFSYKEDGNSCKYYISGMGFQVSILQNKVMLVSSADIKTLLKRHFSYDSAPEEVDPIEVEALSSEADLLELEGEPADSLVDDKDEILSRPGLAIAFYTSKAGDFIESIVGNGITLAADKASGSFSREKDSIYTLDMKMDFVNKHAVKPALFLFKKVQPDGEVMTEKLSENAISCTGMRMDINKIVSLLIGG